MRSRQRLWIFDLDNTLHNASARVFPQINRAMMQYIQRHLDLDEMAATELRQHYWRRYGATLQGLVRHHGIDAAHFLHETHQFEQLDSLLEYESGLRATLARLVGRKVVFSNGPAHYAEAVLGAMGLLKRFDRIYTIENVSYRPKPDLRSFRRVLRAERTHARQAVMVEDSLDNVRAAKRLGMTTVWVTASRKPAADADHIVRSVLELPRIASSV